MKTDSNSAGIFNLDLTPDNARTNGYKYIEDVIYNVLAPREAEFDILRLIFEHGYRLGTPTRSNKPFYGLYAPIYK